MTSQGRTANGTDLALRWSSARDCARKAVYEATGAPHRERTLKEERQLARGRSVGRDYILAIARENRWTVWVASGSEHWVPENLRAESRGTASVIAEYPVKWPLGVGHADAYVPDLDTVLEVLSSQHASPEMIHSKLVQARGYAEWLPATTIAVRIVNPVTLEDEQATVTHGTPLWDDLGAEVRERVRQVLDWNRDGARSLPARVCERPADAHGHFCLYAEHCFDGWEAPQLESVLDDPEVHQIVSALHAVKTRERELVKSAALAETERKAIQQQLEALVPAGKHQVGAFQVVNSPRTRDTFDLARARQDSRIPAELLDEFTKRSAFTVWTVDRNGNGQVDYGEEAPF